MAGNTGRIGLGSGTSAFTAATPAVLQRARTGFGQPPGTGDPLTGPVELPPDMEPIPGARTQKVHLIFVVGLLGWGLMMWVGAYVLLYCSIRLCLANIVCNQIDKGAHLQREVLAVRIECIDRIFGRQKLSKERHQRAGFQILRHRGGGHEDQAVAESGCGKQSAGAAPVEDDPQ
jgi:hypothetical protein